MSFHEREYEVYVFLGNPQAAPLWQWPEWSKAADILTPVMAAARSKPAVRTTQETDNRKISFGRLGWDNASHQKWTHSSPITEKTSPAWEFLNVEAWAPSWTVCEREIKAPDVFLSVKNEDIGGGLLAFNPVLILAVSMELPLEVRGAGRQAASQIAGVMKAVLVAKKLRPWGVAWGSVGFSDSIQDLAVSGLFKPGKRHQRPVDLSTFAEVWEPFQCV